MAKYAAVSENMSANRLLPHQSHDPLSCLFPSSLERPSELNSSPTLLFSTFIPDHCVAKPELHIMDPVSAISLASSIIAFIDFSWELVAGTWEIYRSPDGVLDKHAQLEDVIEDLKSLTEPLKAKVPTNTPSETKIQRLARYCQEDSQSLLKLLSELQLDVKRRTIWSSLSAKWKSILKKDEVSQLRSQLQEYRAQIQFHVTFMMQ